MDVTDEMRKAGAKAMRERGFGIDEPDGEVEKVVEIVFLEMLAASTPVDAAN